MLMGKDESPLIEVSSVDTTVEDPKEEPRIEVGQWYWVKGKEDGTWLGCVSQIGTNYAEVQFPHRSYVRIHFDKFQDSIERRELDPDTHINAQVQKHKRRVEALLIDIKKLTSKLGLTPAGEITDGSQSNALVVAHGTKNIKAHKNALIKAKEETLPELFEKVKREHEEMATWMKATLIPMKAEAHILQTSTETIDDRIFVVELYAGLCEEVTQIRKGEPASNDEKIHLFQRRHYMDEECLVRYEAGGMEFKDIRDFDRWLMRKGNRERILPLPKCVVAFQVRRDTKERNDVSLHEYIKLARIDKLTFLYIRNGDSYYRLSTEIDFGPQLFPDEDRNFIMQGKLYMDQSFHRIISEKDYKDRRAKEAAEKKEYKEKMVEWRKLSKAQKKEKCAPSEPWYHDRYEEVNPDNVYYDDGMAEVAKVARDHNRIAVVLQGLLDRSPVFHPHPPWKLWTPEGFANGIELRYDTTRGLTVGDAPDFEAYRSFINTAIEKGTNTVGQQLVWDDDEERRYRNRFGRQWHLHVPYGNPGPGNFAKVVAVGRNGDCTYLWTRERMSRGRWVNNPDRPGWMKRDNSEIPCRFRCPSKFLLNLDDYTPGDYKQFYEDPRTRVNYLRWAPMLLAAEDFHARDKK